MQASWWNMKGDPDLLFNEDGTVRLPKLAGVAIAWAERSHGCITRQPTRERAEAVADAIRGRVEARGLVMEIRPGRKSDTFGVYVLPNARESLAAGVAAQP